MDSNNDVVTFEIAGANVSISKSTIVQDWLARIGTEARPPSLSAPPRIGTEWTDQGGVYAGVIRGVDGYPDYHLIVPTAPQAKHSGIAFANVKEPHVIAKTDDYDGERNTINLYECCSPTPAAQWAYELVIGEHNDFYLPSRNELRIIEVNVPELFDDGWYWSSTQSAIFPRHALLYEFDNCSQNSGGMSNEFRAQAVRRVLIEAKS